MFIQMSAGMSRAFSKAMATLSDTLRLPLIVSLSTEAFIPVSADSCFWVMPRSKAVLSNSMFTVFIVVDGSKDNR